MKLAGLRTCKSEFFFTMKITKRSLTYRIVLYKKKEQIDYH